jgi:hypothetical protein
MLTLCKPTLSASSVALLRGSGAYIEAGDGPFRRYSRGGAPSRHIPPTITYDDIERFRSDDDTTSAPLHARAPNVGYLLRLGVLRDGRSLNMYGMTSDFSRRLKEHRAEHGACQIIMVVNVGTDQPKHLEDVMKAYFRDKEVVVDRPSGSRLLEVFAVPPLEQNQYFSRFHDYILRSLSGSVRHVTFEGVTTSFARTRCGEASAADLAVLLEIEKQKTAQEREKTARFLSQ